MNNYYYKIPAELAESGKPLKALLYGVIVSLTRKNGTCTASNAFLAKKLGRKDKSIISKYLQCLKIEGWIIIIQIKKAGNRRKITLSPLRKNTMTSPEKNTEPSLEKNKESNIGLSKNIIKEYSTPTQTPKKIDNQEGVITELMDYYKKKAQEKHSLEFFVKKEDKENKMMRNLFINCLSRFGRNNSIEFIDWWLNDNGKWANYLPSRAFHLSVYQEFDNKNRLIAIEKEKQRREIIIL